MTDQPPHRQAGDGLPDTIIRAIENWQRNRMTTFTPSNILHDFGDQIIAALRATSSPSRDSAEGAREATVPAIMIEALIGNIREYERFGSLDTNVANEICLFASRAIAAGKRAAPPKPAPDAMREACASLVESCHDFKVTGSTPGPDATPEALATAACRWLVSSLAKQIREMPISETLSAPLPSPDALGQDAERGPSSDGAGREPTPDMRIAGGIAWAEASETAETFVDCADACWKAMWDARDNRHCPNGLEHGRCLFPDCVSSCPGRLSLSASGTGAAEPVAWQWRKKGPGFEVDGKDVWSDVDYNEAVLIKQHPEKYEVRPLYASPPVRGDRELLAETIHKARYRPDRTPQPFANEDAHGREYCFRLADAILSIPVQPAADKAKFYAALSSRLASDMIDIVWQAVQDSGVFDAVQPGAGEREAFIEVCDRLGCAYDRDSFLATIENLEQRAAGFDGGLLDAATHMRDMLTSDGEPPSVIVPEDIDANEFTQTFDNLATAIRAVSK